MIETLVPQNPTSKAVDVAEGRFDQLHDAIVARGFRGEISRDHAARAAMSTDNSVYELKPDLIVAPRDEADVVLLLEVMAEPCFGDIPLTPRGGGTGTNGQSLNRGVILNFQRFMRRILLVNEEEGWADVEPGLVLDELNAALADKNLFFAPNTSTASRCTIGGMVGTDASGKGSRTYGKTSDNVLGLTVVLDQGHRLSSFEPSPDWAAPLLQTLAQACDAGRDALIEHTPRINRRFTGYDLERARPDAETLEWWRLFLGAEGTLGIVTRIRVKLTPIPAHKRLVVVAFNSFDHALLSGIPLLSHDPVAVEIMDGWVGRLAREAKLTTALPEEVRGGPGNDISHVFVEFVGADTAELDDRSNGFVKFARSLEGVDGTYIALDAAEQKRLWAIRAAAVGLLSKRDGRHRPVAFIEDSVVPVENLVPFVAGFDALMREHGLNYGIYGHIDVGCLHVRPALDLDDEADQAKFAAISDAVYALCKANGGIFWGEHGKGIRGAYLPDFVGSTAYAALQIIKRAFDPAERFNPGKLVVVERPRIGITDLPFRRGNAPGDLFERSFHCNGNAACLSFSRATPMCPSYQATRDIRQSPKGRADALRQWHQGQIDGIADIDAYEDDLFDTLRTCLSCNACASRCPVQVSIPAMKSAFLDQYYKKRGRPWQDHFVTMVEAAAGLVDQIRPLARLGMALTGNAVPALLGMHDAPAISAKGLRQLDHPVAAWHRLSAQLARQYDIAVLADPFTSMFDTQALADICNGFVALGYRPIIVTLPSGAKSSHVLGLQNRYLKRAQKQVAALHHLAAAGMNLVAADPAFALLTRQEFRHISHTTPHVALPQEFLTARQGAGDIWPRAKVVASRRLMGHCTEMAALPSALKTWELVFSTIGLTVRPVETGCCGMAGLFGHDKQNQDMSRDLFSASWEQAVTGEEDVLATGFSCRCQIKRLSATQARHPMAFIAEALS